MKKPVKIGKLTLPLWGWLLGGLVILGALGGGGSKEEQQAQAARDAQLAAQQETRAAERAKEDERRAAEAKAKQEQLARQSIDQATFEIGCQNLIKRQLKLPDTARFRGFWESLDDKPVITETNATWRSWVEAENSFGGTVRNDFVCRYEKATDELRVEMMPR